MTPPRFFANNFFLAPRRGATFWDFYDGLEIHIFGEFHDPGVYSSFFMMRQSQIIFFTLYFLYISISTVVILK